VYDAALCAAMIAMLGADTWNVVRVAPDGAVSTGASVMVVCQAVTD
jgi:hypothetical protein